MPLLPDKNTGGTPMTTYMDDLRTRSGSNKTKPIGTLLTHMLRKLAWEDPALRELADYFFHSGVGGLGKGEIRNWSQSIFSQEIRKGILTRGISNKVWDEWGLSYM